MENLTPQQGPPVRPIRRFKPQEILITPDGDSVLDLGQVIAGYVSLTVDAPSGVEIKLEHSEVFNEHGNFINNIIGVNKDQTDIYITKEGRQSYTPWFTYHGFRFVRITGWPGVPTIEDFEAIVLSSDMRDTGSFSTSDERLNRLQENIWWSQVGNTLSIPTDCPQRERAGWTGDIFAYAPTAAFNRDVDAFLTRWLTECRHDQLDAGEIPMVVPYLPGYRNVVAKVAKTDTSCGWGDAILGVPWALYKAYGNKQVLVDNYDAMKRWIRYAENRVRNHHPVGYKSYPADKKQRSSYLWNSDFHYGDWLIPSMLMQDDADAGTMALTALLTMFVVGPAYFAYSTAKFAEIAELLDHAEDARYYRDLNQKVRRAFIEEFVHEDGTMDADFQGIYVIALQMGLVTEELRPKMVQHLCALIEKNRNCLDTGFLSIPFLMDVLCKNGRRDVAYKLLFQENCPSWLYEVKNGATTMWEAWQAITPDGVVSNSSYNHYAFGCVGDWMYREVAGLTALEPGYKRMRIRPGLDSGLSHVKSTHETPYGKALANWSVTDNMVTLQVEVPAGCEAEICLPNSAKLDDTQIEIEGNVFTALSGEYIFTYPLAEGLALCTSEATGTPVYHGDVEYAPRRQTRKKVHNETTLEEILANPAAMAVLGKVAPELESNPLVLKVKTMTIEQMLTFLQVPPAQYKLLLGAINGAGLFIK